MEEYLDDLGDFFAIHGMPRVAGRVLAQLLIGEGPEQDFAAICEAVGASRASVSTMTRLLSQLGLVERRPGARRRVSYRIRADAWTQLLEDDLKNATQLRRFAKRGRALVKGRVARARLGSMLAFYTFLEAQTRDALEKWSSR